MSDNAPHLSDEVDPEKLLVEIVQGLLMAHARLDHLETTLTTATDSASRKSLHAAKDHQGALMLRLAGLATGQTAQVDAARADRAAQGEDWKSLNLFLRDWQARLSKADAEAKADAKSNARVVCNSVSASEAAIKAALTRMLTEAAQVNHKEAQKNRVRLGWITALAVLSLLAALSLLCLGGVALRMFGRV